VTAGPPRSAYPILVRVTSSTESSDEAVRLASAVADAIIARHKKRYDEALARHLELEQRLERRYLELKLPTAVSPPLDGLLKLERELDEVKTANTSPTHTQMTQLVSDVAPGAVIRPNAARNAAVAAVVAAAGLALIAAIAGYFIATPSPKHKPDAQDP
jgi:hypothetical protein